MALNKYRLDTHCLIWFQENNPKLPRRVIELIQDQDNIILFSQVSLFEFAIKLKIGKIQDSLVSVEDIYFEALKDDFTFLPIKNPHIYTYHRIPLFENHRDPFDRLLIATAIEENAIILSVDEKFEMYSDMVEIKW